MKPCDTVLSLLMKMCYIYIKEFKLAIKKNKVMTFTGKQMELQSVLNEMTPYQKDKICVFSIMCGS